jgi:hypothetical protein
MGYSEMGKMTSHEFLINIIGSTVLNIVPFPSAPIAPSGVLVNNFGYAIRLTEFGETVHDLMKKRGAKIPDLLLVNEKEKLLISVECKSDFTFEMKERLSKQIQFFSSEDFKKIWKEMFPSLNNLEIWLVSYEKLGEKIADYIRRQANTTNPTNIVVWEVILKEPREEAHIQKVYGRHLDNKLNGQMESGGLVSSLPRTELLVDPTLSYGERVFRIGRRILSFMASAYLTEKERIIAIQDFRERYPDAIMTDGELKRCLRYLMKLIPEIGEYNSATGEIVLAKRPSLDKIKVKLENIQKMAEDDIKIELAKISKREKGVVSLKRPKPQKTRLDKWLPEKNVSESSRLPSFKRHVKILDVNDVFPSRFAETVNSITVYSSP